MNRSWWIAKKDQWKKRDINQPKMTSGCGSMNCAMAKASFDLVNPPILLIKKKNHSKMFKHPQIQNPWNTFFFTFVSFAQIPIKYGWLQGPRRSGGHWRSAGVRFVRREVRRHGLGRCQGAVARGRPATLGDSRGYPSVLKRGNWKSTRTWDFNRKITSNRLCYSGSIKVAQHICYISNTSDALIISIMKQ